MTTATAIATAHVRPTHRPATPLTARVPSQLAPTAQVYRRRRATVAVFLAAFLVSLGSLAQQGDAGDGVPARPGGYVVQPGDTLWAVAERLYPGADLGAVVDAMVTLNGGARIQPGQLIVLP